MKYIFLLLIFSTTVFTGQYLVKFKNENELTKRSNFISQEIYSKLNTQKLSASSIDKLYQFKKIAIIDQSQLASFNNQNIEFIEPIITYKVEQSATNDPRNKEQYGFRNVNAARAWEISKGEGVIIAIIDTGIDLEHEDLVDNFWINSAEDINNNGRFDFWASDSTVNGISGDLDGIDNDNNGFSDDVIGYDFVDQAQLNFGDSREIDPIPLDLQDHGTNVAGIIAAKDNNQIGISGISPASKLMILRAFDITGEAESDDIARSIIYAALNGAKVINMSFGEQFVNSAIVESAIEFAHELNCFMVSSAGNSNNPLPHYPSDLPQVVSVAATDENNNRYGFSSYGSFVDISAPGLRVLTTSIGSNYEEVTGTSFAAPHVASAAAILLSINPDLDPDQLRTIIQLSSFDLGDRGWDPFFGSGLLNIYSAINYPKESLLEISSPKWNLEFNSTQDGAVIFQGSTQISSFKNVEYFLGKGEYPDRLSNEDLEYLKDSLIIADSLANIDTPELRRDAIIRTYTENNFNVNDIENFKWVDLDSSDLMSNNILFELDINGLQDTIYTFRAKVTLQNNSTIERRLPFRVVNGGFAVVRADLRNVITENKEVPLLFTSTNRDATLSANYGDQFEADLEFGTTNNWVIFDELNTQGNRDLNYSLTSRNGEVIDRTLTRDLSPSFIAKNKFENVLKDYEAWNVSDITLDLNQNGKPEFFVNSLENGFLSGTKILEYENEEFTELFITDETWVLEGVGDSDGDGNIELLTTSALNVSLFEYVNGTLFNNVIFEEPTLSWVEGMIDINGDGREELIINDRYFYSAYTFRNGTYEKLVQTTLPQSIFGEGVERQGIVDDIDNDGNIEFCISNRRGFLLFYEYNSNSQDTLLTLQNPITSEISFSQQFMDKADLDGDGILEIITGSIGGYEMFRTHNTKKEIWQFRAFKLVNGRYTQIWNKYIDGVRNGPAFGAASYRNGIKTGDVDNDGDEEILISTFPDIYVFDYENDQVEPVWHYSDGFTNSFNVSDLDENDKNEVWFNTLSGLKAFEINQQNIEAFGLRGYAEDQTTARLFWNNNSSNYELYEMVNGNPMVVVETSESEALISDLSPNTEYLFALKACDGSDNCSEFSGQIRIVTAPRTEILGVNVLSPSSIIVNFSEDISSRDVSPQKFQIQELDVNPYSANISSRRSILLDFENVLESGVYDLRIDTLYDVYNNPIQEYSFKISISDEPDLEEMAVSNFSVIDSDQIEIIFNYDIGLGVLDDVNYLFEPEREILGLEEIGSNKIRITLSKNSNSARGVDNTIKLVNMFSNDGVPITEGPGSLISFVSSANGLSDIYVYPHPINRSSSDQVYFGNLTDNCRVDIFDTNGGLLRSMIENDGNGGVEWDLIDKNGSVLETGIYLWRVEDLETGESSDLQKLFIKN